LMLRSEARNLSNSNCLSSILLKIVACMGEPGTCRDRDSWRWVRSFSARRISSPTRNPTTFSPRQDSDFNPLSLLDGWEAEEDVRDRSRTSPAKVWLSLNW
jgi:hypothetical protein